MSRIFVNNLPKQTTEKSLRDLFGQKGSVTDCSLKYTKDGQFRRFAFIGFSSTEEAQAAQKYFDKTFVNTSKIHVEIAADLGNMRKRPWSKHSRTQSPQKTEKEKQTEAKKRKKEEKEAALLGELHNDPEFKEYMAVYMSKGHKAWDNDEGENEEQKGEESDEESGGKPDSEGEKEEEEEVKTSISKKMSDLDFLKSKMVGSALLSSDEDDENDKDGSVAEKKSSPKKISEQTKADSADPVKTSSSQKTEEAENKTEEAPKQKFCLKMKGLPATAKESAIREFFKPLRVKIRMPKNKNNLSIGFAFVECRTEKVLEAALQKNKSFIGKKKIFLQQVLEETPVVKEVNETPRPWEQKAQRNEEEDESIAESGRLFVRNLAYQCTEEGLEALFAKYGAVAELELPVDSFTKQIKGFAHVTYMKPEDAVKAFTELDGMAFMGRLLHILPGKDREQKYVSSEKSSYKKKKDEKTKALAKSSHNWNTLFLSADAVATAMAAKYKTDKSQILDDSKKGSLGVRLGLGETQLVHETRQFLIENGVALDSFSQADGERSKTVILAKDLPAGTQADQLEEVFSKYGTLARVLLPPHGSAAIVEFVEPTEAKRAFTHQAYRRFVDRPLYLEWAPMTVFNKGSSKDTSEEQHSEESEKELDSANNNSAEKNNAKSKRNAKSVETRIQAVQTKEEGDSDSESEGESEPGSTLFVKNLNFDTQDAALKEVFSKVGKVRRATVAKKKDMKNPGQFLSMGYGFVEFKKAASATEALKTLQKHELDGHQLELKISQKEVLEAKSGRKRQASSQKGSTKILIRNIPFQCNKKEITELFKVFGKVKYVRVPKKSYGSGIQGFGFVEFLTKQSAKRAFDALCHSTHLYGRRLVLEWARSEETIEELQRKTAQKFNHGPSKNKSLKKQAIMESLEN